MTDHPAFRSRCARLLLVALGAAWTFSGCGSSGGTTKYDYDSGIGGPVTGALDNHCKSVAPVIVNESSCHEKGDPDAGVAPEPAAPILFTGEGDDDDCKYHLAFRSTIAQQNKDATLEVTLTHLADGKPATGAEVDLEVYLANNDTHLLPNGTKPAVEKPAGVYTLTPLHFDAAGRWVIRFHLYEECTDIAEDSPHGHVAFYFDVAAP